MAHSATKGKIFEIADMREDISLSPVGHTLLWIMPTLAGSWPKQAGNGGRQ
ncbi:MAG: hypothetical protein V7676_13890 [Parasphingorhabdus sp.]|uniref:hypothetical protein n=1 Tax=Parasphingorhabdus sp. TaxID=2709688 RepID=UPI00300127F4